MAPLSIPVLAIHSAENAAQLSNEVTIYTNGNEDLAEQLKSLVRDTFKVDSRHIKHLVDVDGGKYLKIEFTDGSYRDEAFLVHNPQTTVQGPFITQLGITTTPMGDILAEAPMHQTSIRGVFAAGDCITPYKVIPGAISSGCNAAVAVSTQLQAEKYGQAPMF